MKGLWVGKQESDMANTVDKQSKEFIEKVKDDGMGSDCI